MKKIIAISVMFALIAGAVFADTSVSGLIETRFTLIDGSTAKNFKPKTFGSVANAYIQLSGSNDDGTLGGTARIRNEDFAGHLFHRAFVWWKPVEQVKVFLGVDPDGLFGTDPLESWGYHRGSEGYINNHDWGFWRTVFPGNWDTFGLAFSFYFVEGLEVNLAIPTGNDQWPPYTSGALSKKWRVEDMYIAGLRLQANYAIDGLGKFFLVYNGGNNVNQPPEAGSGAYPDYDAAYDPEDPDSVNKAKKYEADTNGQIGASFLLTSLEGFQIHFGGATLLAKHGAKAPIHVGLGVHYDGGSGFGAKFRIAYVLNSGWNDKLTAMRFSVMPWYALEKFTVFFDFGANMDMGGGSSTTAWFVNPYITAPLGGGKFQIGLKVNNNGGKGDAAVTTYSLPMLLQFSF